MYFNLHCINNESFQKRIKSIITRHKTITLDIDENFLEIKKLCKKTKILYDNELKISLSKLEDIISIIKYIDHTVYTIFVKSSNENFIKKLNKENLNILYLRGEEYIQEYDASLNNYKLYLNQELKSILSKMKTQIIQNGNALKKSKKLKDIKEEDLTQLVDIDYLFLLLNGISMDFSNYYREVLNPLIQQRDHRFNNEILDLLFRQTLLG
ncbi:hypothetical protein AB837_00552 [bacterium AB1]|nr:hypothetical protein AB837_00552 [bacterium AB1]